MIATRRTTAIAGAVVAAVVAVALATAAGAEPAGASKRPRGVLLDCSTQSSHWGGAPGGTFRAARNLVVGPIAMTGAAVRPAGSPPDFRGNKFPIYMRGGHRVTVQVARRTQGAKLIYGQRGASRVFTFISCRRDDFPPPNPSSHVACCFSFWAGGVRARPSQCVHLLFWVDDEIRPRRAVIHLGVPDCG
jgi:hypothetical protein